jgi:hypothetical protein
VRGLSYHYPIERLPHQFSALVGMSSRIYQTICEGAFAFLVVVGSGDPTIEKNAEKLKKSLLKP